MPALSKFTFNRFTNTVLWKRNVCYANPASDCSLPNLALDSNAYYHGV